METRVQIDNGGGIVLPANFRKALKIKAGDEILVRLENGSIRLIPLQPAIQFAQNAVKRYVPEGESLVEGLIKMRREAAGHE